MMNKTYLERNIQIKNMRDKGHTLKDISKQFGLSESRVGLICEQFDRDKRRIDSLGNFGKYFDLNDEDDMRAFNCVARNLMRKGKVCDEDILSLTDKDIMSMRGVGKYTSKIIRERIELFKNGKENNQLSVN